jgi:hypothetical protein
LPDDRQKAQLRNAIPVISARYPQLKVIALFFDPRHGFERIT